MMITVPVGTITLGAGLAGLPFFAFCASCLFYGPPTLSDLATNSYRPYIQRTGCQYISYFHERRPPPLWPGAKSTSSVNGPLEGIIASRVPSAATKLDAYTCICFHRHVLRAPPFLMVLNTFVDSVFSPADITFKIVGIFSAR